MMRQEDLSEITDGRTYTSADTVKIGTLGCKGCSECCHVTADTIKLDPLDIWRLQMGAMELSFEKLLEKKIIELKVVDGLILPNLTMKRSSSPDYEESCVFLGEDERCQIHHDRPGYCRMFPLGRMWDESGDFRYILQVHECPHMTTKVKIKKWLDIPGLSVYEQYIRSWHTLTVQVRNLLAGIQNEALKTKICTGLLEVFFSVPWEEMRSFYDQYQEREAQFRQVLGLAPAGDLKK